MKPVLIHVSKSSYGIGWMKRGSMRYALPDASTPSSVQSTIRGGLMLWTSAQFENGQASICVKPARQETRMEYAARWVTALRASRPRR